jgi:tetratricopeptide (TPR) repeat protein
MKDQVRPVILIDFAVDAAQEYGVPSRSTPRTTSDQRPTEQQMARTNRAIAAHDFDCDEEVQAFVDDYLRRGLPEEGPPLTPLEQAQELVYKAWEVETSAECWRLARRALRLSPDCADAYLLLAEAATPDLWEVLRLCREAVTAAERALGPDAFSPDSDLENWWKDLFGRPYLRAKARLALALWRLGQWTEATGHLQDLLRLNPHDNQGMRFRLLNWLVFLGEPAPVRRLIHAYPKEDAAAWQYSLALWLFRQEGDSPEARRQAKLAWAANPHVPGFLLDIAFLPGELPPAFWPGGKDEAVFCAYEARPVWHSVEGARKWLASALAEELGASYRPTRRVGRNEPCPCGSGKKYKRCCLDKEVHAAIQSAQEHRNRPWDPDEVRAMSTPAILAKLASLGPSVTEEDVRVGARVHPSAKALSKAWLAGHSFTATGLDEDFPWFAAEVLWERLNLRPLPGEIIHDLLWFELDQQTSDRLPNPENWLRAWDYLKQHAQRLGLHRLAAVGEALDLDLNLDVWFVLLLKGLQQEAEEDRFYMKQAFTVVQEFVALFPDDAPKDSPLRQAADLLGVLEESEKRFLRRSPRRKR